MSTFDLSRAMRRASSSSGSRSESKRLPELDMVVGLDRIGEIGGGQEETEQERSEVGFPDWGYLWGRSGVGWAGLTWRTRPGRHISALVSG